MAFDLHRWLDQLQARSEAEARPRLKKLAAAAQTSLELVQQLVVDFAPRNAAALAYTTILAVVPVLAVSFALVKAFVPDQELAGTVRAWLLQTLFAENLGQVLDVIEGFLNRAQGGAVGIVGFVFLLVTALSTFLTIERTFNNIWRVPSSRPLYRRLVTFYAVITLAPALIGVGFAAARWIKGGLAHVPFGLTFSATVLPVALQVAAMTMMFKLMPHTAVQWRSALAGGTAAAVGFELSKWGFNTYIKVIYTGSVQAKIYGSFALIPVFFLWIYLSWLIVLTGVQLSYLVQNRQALTRALITRRGGRDLVLPTGYLVARVFFEVARHFRERGGGLPPREIAARLQIPLNEVQPAVQMLRRAQLVLSVESDDADVELVPSRPLDRIRLAELYERCESIGYQPGELPADPVALPLETHLGEVEQVKRAALERTVESFLAEAAEKKEPAATPPKNHMPA